MRRRVLALAAALGLLLTGCGRRGQAPGPAPETPTATQSPGPAAVRELVLPLDPAGGWDPYEGSRSSNMSLAPLLYESLFQLDQDFGWHPLLAREATASADGLVWTVTLQSGVSFSDGTPLTAKEAGEAINAARGDKSIYKTRLKGVRKVEWDKELTLTFTLDAPNARFPALLDFPVARVTKDGVFGTGPYVPVEGALAARSDWWRGLDLPRQRIALLETESTDALIDAFNAGALSVVAADPTGTDALGYAGSCQPWEYPTTNLVYLGFQCGRGPCKSAAFRQAVCRTLDRGGLIAQALEGHAAPAFFPAPQGAGLYEVSLERELGQDYAAVAQALDELGYQTGDEGQRMNGRKPLELELLVNADNVRKERLANLVAAGLEAVGVKVQVKVLAWEAYQKALERGEFDLYLAECRMTGDLDPSPFLTRGSGLCYGGFADGELTRLLAEARKTGEWGDFYSRWAGQMPMAPLCFKNAQLLTQWGQVTGARPTQSDLFYGFESWKIS